MDDSASESFSIEIEKKYKVDEKEEEEEEEKEEPLHHKPGETRAHLHMATVGFPLPPPPLNSIPLSFLPPLSHESFL